MLIRRVIHHQIYGHPNAPLLRSVSEFHEIADRVVSGVDAVIVGDVTDTQGGRQTFCTAFAGVAGSWNASESAPSLLK
jgi:hypothetical protein